MGNVRRMCLVPVVVAFIGALSGCATLLNEPYQMVAFDSEPSGAVVGIDNVNMGNTPCVIPVPRKGWDKAVTFSKAGYKTVQYTLKNALSMPVLGNILLGGIPGLVVDGISGRGGGYQQTVKVVLEPSDQAVPQTSETPKAE